MACLHLYCTGTRQMLITVLVVSWSCTVNSTWHPSCPVLVLNGYYRSVGVRSGVDLRSIRVEPVAFGAGVAGVAGDHRPEHRREDELERHRDKCPSERDNDKAAESTIAGGRTWLMLPRHVAFPRNFGRVSFGWKTNNEAHACHMRGRSGVDLDSPSDTRRSGPLIAPSAANSELRPGCASAGAKALHGRR